ncbi:MAG: pilus assembly protein PilM [Candidatus Omnitrophota bacterium]
MNTILEQLQKEYKSLLAGMGFGPKTTNFIGLDIGSRYFRVVRIKKIGDEFSIQDTLVDKIEELGNLSGKMRVKDEEELCANFNLEGIVIKRVSIPVMPQGEIESALKWELKEHVGFDIDKARIRFKILEEKETEDGAKKIELIAFAYQESDIEPRVKQLKEMGLNVQNVMPLNFAIARYINDSKIIPQDEKAAIVDIGSAKTLISIIEKDKVYFTREILAGGDTITEAMTGVTVSDKGRMELSKEDAENMKIEQGISSDIKILSLIRPVLEKLTSQIRSSLEYCESQFSCAVIKKIILAGNGSKLKGLREYFVKEMGIEVLTILPENAGAIGLALSADSDLNMLPEKFKTEDKKALKRFSITAIIAILGFVLALSYAFLYAKAVNLKREVRIQKQYRDNLKEVKLLRDEIMAYNSAISIASSNGVNAVKIMKELSNIVIPGAVFDRLVINYTEPNVIIGGIALKQDFLTEFMSKLESNPMFQNVRLSFSEQNQGFGPEAIKFEIISNVKKR